MASMGSRSLLATACAAALRPVVRLLLKSGWTHREFADLARRVFVEVASTEFGKRGRPANASRVAILTGINRKDVSRLRAEHAPNDDAAASIELTVRERASWWISVPSVFQMQLALPDFERYDLSAVRLIVWEGAAMPAPIVRRLLEIAPGGLATNYSMTESTGAITVVPPTTDVDLLASTVGTPAHGVEVRIVGEDGRELPPGESGEIQARSPYNMLGYWNRPEETAATLLPDGWLRTGDVGVQLPDGNYRIVGRLKEMFKSGGYNVYPREVENVLESHPAIELAAVVGRPDPLWQEVGVAYVIARSPVTVEALEAHCRERLASYKVPKAIEIRDSLPLLPIGKVDKGALRALAAEAR